MATKRIRPSYRDVLTGTEHPIDADILSLLTQNQLYDKDKVSYANVLNGPERFESWAINHFIPGDSVPLLVEKKYLDLYVMLNRDADETATSKSRKVSTNDQLASSNDEVSKAQANNEDPLMKLLDQEMGGLGGKTPEIPKEPADDSVTQTQTTKSTQSNEMNQHHNENTTRTNGESSSSTEEQSSSSETEEPNASRKGSSVGAIRDLFNSYGKRTTLGQITVAKPLKKSQEVRGRLNSNIIEMQRSILSEFVATSIDAQNLVRELSVADVQESYTMYLTAASGYMSTDDFHLWAKNRLLEAVSGIMSFQQVILDSTDVHSLWNSKEASLNERTRWFLFLCDIIPTGYKQEPTMDVLLHIQDAIEQWGQSSLDASNLTQSTLFAMMGSAPEGSWDASILSNNARKYRNFILSIRDDLLKPYKTIFRTKKRKK